MRGWTKGSISSPKREPTKRHTAAEMTFRGGISAASSHGCFATYGGNGRGEEGAPGNRGRRGPGGGETPSFRYWPSTGGNITYFKTALWLHTLERWLGWPTLQRAMSTYFDRWKFRHPRPDDFFQTVSEVSGRDLTSFFDQVYRSSNTFD